MNKGYWERQVASRRAFLRSVLAGGTGIAALSLVGCSGDDEDSSSDSGEAVVSDQGIQGGTFVMNNAGHPGGWVISTGARGFPAGRAASLVHSGLLYHDYGRPPSDGFKVGVEPDLAASLPEQPDPLTFNYKIRPGVTFHDGTPLTAEDIKYSLEKVAFDPASSARGTWFWLERVDAVDAQTVVVKSKVPYVDALVTQAPWGSGYIVSKKFDESPEAAQKLMGTGPYTWGSDTPPVETVLKKNPNYYLKPYPYFNEIKLIGQADQSKQVADFAAKQTHYPYWLPEEPRNQVRTQRPDAKEWGRDFPRNLLRVRSDIPPFNDKRLRQALSMSLNRKSVRDGVHNGEGRDDSIMSPAHDPGGIQGYLWPDQLGAQAKYMQYNPTEAMALARATGVTLPIRSTAYSWDATVVGAALPDSITLIVNNWKQIGIADIKQETYPVADPERIGQGNFEGMRSGPGHQGFLQALTMRNSFFSPPAGVAVPTTNHARANNPELSSLVDRQTSEVDPLARKSMIKRIIEIIQEEMYNIGVTTYQLTWFTDPRLQNTVAPHWGYTGSVNYVKYWWFKG